ncbi:MAG TPA: class E sortase [Acidimicrobiia bacterium]|nr:class E sortase [Acidimicrobiia bacterium]
MNLRWTLRRTSPVAAVALLAGGLVLVASSRAPRTHDAFDVPTMVQPVAAEVPAGPTTTATVATTTTTAPPTPIVYDSTPPGGRRNLGGDVHPMVAQQPFGMIVIPKINLVHPIFEGIDEPDIHWGPGHWPGSALPGQRGNTVFAGHRVTHTRPFLDIDLLAPGDLIIFHLATGTFTYQVTGHTIVYPKDTWIADPTDDATVTIFACHPKHSALQRYVVRGKLIASGPYSPV